MIKWLTYSGASVIITVNPLHWRLVPQAGRAFTGEWAGPNERTWYASWMFLTLRVWIDDGSW
jgi:hypothetical protein